ncbi:MAG: LuxR C-terminal-related transcriptional regulator [Planctomycetota bacterium]|nr:LuxR C-terminal-related transcriptional regulator [Planctomycetota bacterium]
MGDLTARQQEVLVELLHGRSEKEGAGSLGISRSTLHDHVKAIYRAYEVGSRSELLSLWIARQGDVNGPAPPNTTGR